MTVTYSKSRIFMAKTSVTVFILPFPMLNDVIAVLILIPFLEVAIYK